SCEKGVGRHEHLVSGAEPQRPRGKCNRICAIPYANAVSRANKVSEFLLEFLHNSATDELRSLQNRRYSGIHLFAKSDILGPEVHKRNVKQSRIHKNLCWYEKSSFEPAQLIHGQMPAHILHIDIPHQLQKLPSRDTPTVESAVPPLETLADVAIGFNPRAL